MGGIDHAGLHRATPDDAAAQAREALSHGTERMMLTAGCAIPPQTTAEVRSAIARTAVGA